MKSDINAAALKMLKPGRRDVKTWHDVLTIDPGLGGTGVVFWPLLDRRRSVIQKPKWTRVFKDSNSEADWVTRGLDIAFQIARVSVALVNVTFIEIPRLWTHDKKSRASASRGDLTKLSILAGMIMIGLDTHMRTDGYFATAFPADWKGQLPKEVVDDRILDLLGEKYPDHASDAVGMGLAIQGVL